MRQLYYTFQTLIRGRGSNMIKIVSLTLGLFISILLFARVAFELNYNTAYKDSDRLCAIMATYTMNGVPTAPMQVVMGPVPTTIAEAFPNEIESATVTRYGGKLSLYLGDVEYDQEAIMGDTLFFQTMGITVLQGNILDMANPDVIFISEKFAHKAFAGENPVGKTMMQDKNRAVTVKGVFADIPENNAARPDVVISFATLFKYGGMYFGWGGGDSFQGYVRLRPGVEIEDINPRIGEVIEKHMPFNPEKNGWGVQYTLNYLHSAHVDNPDVKRIVSILSVLGIAILLIAALNYVLISVSSLTLRAKGIAVHKCSGASTGNVFSMFMWETTLIIGASLLLMAVLMISFKEMIESLMEVSMTGLFVWKTMWVPALVILSLYMIAGVLPARMFSSIPVTQVFRRYTEGKRNWKRPLLFVQFAGVSFVFGLLCVVMMQYKQIMNYNLGYNPEGVAFAWYRFQHPEVGKSTLLNLPMVEKVATSGNAIAAGFSGEFIYGPDGKTLFSTRSSACDGDYIPLLEIKIKEGKNMDGPDQVLVNEEFVRLRGWTDSPIGKKPSDDSNTTGIIVGVVENVVENNLFAPKNPIMFVYDTDWRSCVNVRLKPPYRESLDALNRAMKEVFPTDNVNFNYLPDQIRNQYESVRRFRDIVIWAFVSILLITLIGLLGYVNDEVRRRSKEIAIRKVNGAEAYDILSLLSREVAWVALPAAVLGVTSSYFMGKEWLSQFEGFQLSLDIPIFILAAIAVLVIVFGTVILKSWYIANENPVHSIKSE